MSKTYKVIRTCYFAGRLFEAGETASFDDSTGKVPDHFEAVNEVGVQEAEPAKAPVAKSRKKKKE